MQWIGQIELFPVTPELPEGWAACDGQLLSIETNMALFAVVGASYGGDGRSTFGLPDLEAPVPGVQYLLSTTGTFPMAGGGFGPSTSTP